MKRFFGSMMIVMVAVVLSACVAANSQSSDGMINPGDRIGDFLVTTGKGKEVNYPFDYSTRCTGSDQVNFTCEHIVGRMINITPGLYDDSNSAASHEPSARLIGLWSTFNYKLSIEGRPVNVEKFGYIDVQHPMLGVMRFWDVVIVTDKPGKLSYSDSATVDGEPYKSNTTFNFSEP